MPTYSFQPSLYVYFKKSQMNKLVTFSALIMKSTLGELKANELAKGLLICLFLFKKKKQNTNKFAQKRVSEETNLFMN